MTEVVAALIWDGDRFMICQRPAHKARALLWEFVGGKVEPGETLPRALVRELGEELGMRFPLVLDPMYRTLTEKLDIWFIRTLISPGETLICREGQRAFWIDPEDRAETDKLFSEIPLLPNDLLFWKFLRSG